MTLLKQFSSWDNVNMGGYIRIDMPALLSKPTHPMKYSITFLSCILVSLCFAFKAQASEDISDAQIKSLVAQGDSCKQQNNLYRALALYEEAYRYDASAEVLRKIIQCHYERGGYQQCLNLYQTLPADSLTLGDKKMKYFCFSNVAAVDSALYYGRLANREDPYDSRVVSKLASHYNKAQLPDTALHIANAYCEYDSTNVFVNRQKAHALYQMGDYKGAMGEYERLERYGDINESTLYYLALCYAKSNQLMKAYDTFMRAAEIGGYENPHVISQMGIVAIEIGFVEDGVGYVEQSIEMLQPDQKLMYALTNTLAEGYFKWMEYDKSIAHMKQSMKYPDSNFYVYYRIAQAYAMKKDLKNERAYYQKFVDEALKVTSPSENLKELIEYTQQRIHEITETLFFQGEH